jgi:maltodextrin utilization protein YvdJ
MSRPKKKRSKRYQGAGAKQASPQVIRVAAVKRSKTSQWWHENKRSVVTTATVVFVIAVIALLLIGLVQLFIR